MIKIGFIDNFLSEWHANHYPQMIRNHPVAKELGMKICYAYAKTEISPYDGVSTDEWCEKFGVARLNDLAELVEKSDCIVVLSPDHPELHPELADLALKSGKPVYIDKTFAPDRSTAESLFRLAEQYRTPLYSSSSLRFAAELAPYRQGNVPARTCMVHGPFRFDIYAIHIFEIICTVMKGGAKRLMAVQNTRNRSLVVDYGAGRFASFLQMETDDDGIPFGVSVEMPDGTANYHAIKDGYFERFIDALVTFFADGKPPVEKEETVDLMGMLEVARKALSDPFRWYEII